MSRLNARPLAPLLAVLALILAACGQPSEPRPTGLEGTVNTPTGAPTVLAVAMLLIDDSGPSAITADALTQVSEGLYVGPLSPVAEDGSFTLPLPPAADIPANLLGDVQDFLSLLGGFPGCTLQASDPSVQATRLLFEIVSIPTIATMTVEGLAITLASAEPITSVSDLNEVLQSGLQAFVYADGATTVTTDPAECANDSLTLSVDIALAEGWNQLEWSAEFDGSTLTGLALGNSTAEELHVFPVGGF